MAESEESNAHASYGYAQLLMSLIQEWRSERALPSTVSVCRPMKHR